MFIVWGHKRTERKLGFVADFCPICRDVRAFQLIRVGSVGHVYYISFGAGQLVGHIIRCAECKQAFGADPMRYSSYQRIAFTDTHELMEATFPNLAVIHADRLALEAQIRRTPGGLLPRERVDLLLEPFALLNPAVEACFQETRIDRQSSIGCLGSIGIFLLVFGIAICLEREAQDRMLIVAVSLLGIGVVYTIIQLCRGPSRFLQKKIVPILAGALDPLEPTQDELQECLNKCKAAGMKVGAKVKLQTLWAELQRRVTAISEAIE